MSQVTLDAEGNEISYDAVRPRRVTLTLAQVDHLAALAALPSPARQMLESGSEPSSLATRLGGELPDVEPAEPGDDDLDGSLRELGLVDDDGPVSEIRAALQVWHSAALATEVDLLLSLRIGQVRVRAWHRNLEDWVVALSTADRQHFELLWLPAEDWWRELTRVGVVEPARLAPAERDQVSLPEVIETPWELLLATGEAIDAGRHDLLDQLVQDYSGLTTTGSTTDDLEPASDADVRAWHETLERASRGRLHAAIIGRSERGRPGVGVVEWVLFHDGWRSLTPVRREGWNIVRIERREATELSRQLALRAAAVTS
ncbi:hypothetical protein DDE18_15300 [Nocardioides gansuensis]|uniref:Uncharacterized protein n=1 Tax=Nocardioides gansuensis TaxID=2138300 RepID=A0A2T8F8N5_9ACTN|nr:hypothetical protein [Nocardioides gansuensis]PVG82050.1 hypothetical protein DDE18_15300 [Nocardioides gansuensis]